MFPVCCYVCILLGLHHEEMKINHQLNRVNEGGQEQSGPHAPTCKAKRQLHNSSVLLPFYQSQLEHQSPLQPKSAAASKMSEPGHTATFATEGEVPENHVQPESHIFTSNMVILNCQLAQALEGAPGPSGAGSMAHHTPSKCVCQCLAVTIQPSSLLDPSFLLPTSPLPRA